MAEKRMFAKTIVDSDAFLEMPMSARLLYYDLGMRADDDGFVNSPRKLMRMIGATTDDMNVLIARKFVIPFESGVVVIKHWRINNYLRNDRYKETTYTEEKALLEIDESGNYHLKDESGIPRGIPTVYPDKNSIDKSRLDKSKREALPRFVPPSVEEVRAYCTERKNHVDPEAFVDYYERQGWVLSNGQKMKDWKSGVRTWEKRDAERAKQKANEKPRGDFYRIIEHEQTEKSVDSFVNELENKARAERIRKRQEEAQHDKG